MTFTYFSCCAWEWVSLSLSLILFTVLWIRNIHTSIHSPLSRGNWLECVDRAPIWLGKTGLASGWIGITKPRWRTYCGKQMSTVRMEEYRRLRGPDFQSRIRLFKMHQAILQHRPSPEMWCSPLWWGSPTLGYICQKMISKSVVYVFYVICLFVRNDFDQALCRWLSTSSLFRGMYLTWTGLPLALTKREMKMWSSIVFA